MATVTVTRKFKDDFDLWASDVVDRKIWTQEEIEGLKKLMREYELADGPDRLRDQLVNYTPEGKEVPSAINDSKSRYKLWEAYFADEAEMIRDRSRPVQLRKAA